MRKPENTILIHIYQINSRAILKHECRFSEVTFFYYRIIPMDKVIKIKNEERCIKKDFVLLIAILT